MQRTEANTEHPAGRCCTQQHAHTQAVAESLLYLTLCLPPAEFMYSYTPTRMTYTEAVTYCANATAGGRLAGLTTDPSAKAFIYAMCQDPKAKCWVQDNQSPSDGFCTFTADGGISVNQADCTLQFFFVCARPVMPSPPPLSPPPPSPPPPRPPSPPAVTRESPCT